MEITFVRDNSRLVVELVGHNIDIDSTSVVPVVMAAAVNTVMSRYLDAASTAAALMDLLMAAVDLYTPAFAVVERTWRHDGAAAPRIGKTDLVRGNALDNYIAYYRWSRSVSVLVDYPNSICYCPPW